MLSALSRPEFINKLQLQLACEPLPGLSAHLKMAHPVKKSNPFSISPDVRNAAVLMVLFENESNNFNLLFIRRTTVENGDKHSGQIAFPGGKSEPSDPDLMYTALREAEEEIGIDLSEIDVLGSLSPIYINVSNFMVYPYLSYAINKPALIRQEAEIEEILELSLASFQDPSARQETKIHLSKEVTLNHVPCFNIAGTIIWGATAMIMNEFLEILDWV
ncbi:MAG: CoA pyrophosphatase [Saprospiraceae bacterium]